jgi:molecular chaperone DnaK
MSSEVIGIDLGTTNCVVAIYRNGQTVLLTDELGQVRFPSIVTFGDNDVWIGHKAKALGASGPSRMVYAVKRLIGHKFTDEVVRKAYKSYHYKIKENEDNGGVLVQLGDKFYPPEEVSSLILKRLKEMVEEQFGFEPEEAVITVPAHFNHNQREATKRAAKMAGLSVLRLLNEPTAAALSLRMGDEAERLIAVYDFGGGTFDISIIRIQGTVYEVLATNGDTFLGGDDIDGELANELIRDFELKSGVKIKNFPLAVHRLWDAAENAKKELSQNEQCSVYLPRLVAQDELATNIKREKLEKLARSIIERSLKTCQETLQQAKLEKSDLTELILVGGQTRMPLMRKMAEEFFGRQASVGVNPDTAVADGAAKEAAMLKQGKGVLLIDVTPMTLGISILGNRMYPLIPKNTKIPVRKEHVFTTQHDAQQSAKIVILQGEHEKASENANLGQVVLAGLTGRDRFKAHIDVVFEVDSSGILHVKVQDKETGSEEEIVIRDGLGELAHEKAEQVPKEESLQPREEKVVPTISGPFAQTELVDVICFFHANQRTGLVEIKTEQQTGELALKEGEIIWASFGDSEGLEAAKSLLALQDGHYAFYENAGDKPVQIEVPFDSIIESDD